MQSILTKLSDRHQRAAANKAAVDREAALLKQHDKTAAELKQFEDRVAKLNEEFPARIFSETRQRDDEAKPFVGRSFGHKVDVQAAADAFVRLTFTEQQRQWIKDQIKAVEAEAAPLRKKLADIGEQLNRVQSELAG